MPQTTKEQVIESSSNKLKYIISAPYLNPPLNTIKSSELQSIFTFQKKEFESVLSSTYDTAYEKCVRDAMEKIGGDQEMYAYINNMEQLKERYLMEGRNQERSRLRLALSELLKKNNAN